MRKKLIWSVLIITTFWLFLQVSPAHANCPSGNCEAVINSTTGVVFYRDAPVEENKPVFSRPEPTAPTYTINVQTENRTWSTNGTPEQIAQAVEQLKPEPLPASPLPKEKVVEIQKQAEVAKIAIQALPNITPWQSYNREVDAPILPTLLDETITPDWWVEWENSMKWFIDNWFWWWTL